MRRIIDRILGHADLKLGLIRDFDAQPEAYNASLDPAGEPVQPELLAKPCDRTGPLN